MPRNQAPQPLTRDSVQEYLDLVKRALAQIESGYFRLTTTYRSSGITRERIFCYELYHRIRSNMRPQHTLSLHGEIDKSGHIDFAVKDRVNPDIVFHLPSTHSANTLVIEVKGTVNRRYRKGILKDFNTLLTFISKYQYRAGIFILFGHSFGELMKVVGPELRMLRSSPHAELVHILSIAEPHTKCEEHLLSDV
jgi:hypothetical protein